jgi:hypothetical protein
MLISKQELPATLMWIESGQIGDAPGVGFTMNTDLSARAISGENLTAVVAAWRAERLAVSRCLRY